MDDLDGLLQERKGRKDITRHAAIRGWKVTSGERGGYKRLSNKMQKAELKYITQIHFRY